MMTVTTTDEYHIETKTLQLTAIIRNYTISNPKVQENIVY